MRIISYIFEIIANNERNMLQINLSDLFPRKLILREFSKHLNMSYNIMFLMMLYDYIKSNNIIFLVIKRKKFQN